MCSSPFTWHSNQFESWILALTAGSLAREHGSVSSRAVRPSISVDGMANAAAVDTMPHAATTRRVSLGIVGPGLI